MNLSMLTRWRRTFFVLGTLLILASTLLYGLVRTRDGYAVLLRQADATYQKRQYREAIAAYEQVLERTQSPAMRISTLLLGPVVSPASLALQIGNCRYRIAAAELRHYQQASRDPRVKPRPSLVKVQRLLTEAGAAYAEVPQTDPQAYVAAQVNSTRVRSWQLIVAAFDEQTTGRRTLKQQALAAIRQAAAAVDYSYEHRQHISRQTRMTAMLLLETLTAFSQERPPPLPPRASSRPLQKPLGDLLLKDTPELSTRERKRFQQFFFALPIEAKDPWPLPRQGGAGGGQRPVAH